MFIRTKRDKNKKTGKIYERQVLAESVWKDGKSTPHTVMSLGQLELPQSDWKKLAHALECLFTGQESMLAEIDQDIWHMAQRFYSSQQLTKNIRKRIEVETPKGTEYVPVDLSSVETEKSRTLGAELVCDWAWKELNLTSILRQCGLSKRETAVARAVIFGRMIFPDSEIKTYRWFMERSALPEFPGSDITDLGKDLFYTIGDELYNNKDRIETLLYEAATAIYPPATGTVYLYDLTNTYMEGSCLGNELAKRGHCKSKRYDCPLITLALVVDGNGMPIKCMIYEGNQSEPETFPDIIQRIEDSLWNGQQALVKPTIAMDRGIATKEVVAYLKEHNYPYVIIRREDQSEEYRDIFVKERDSFIEASESHINAYGNKCGVYVRKMEEKDGVVQVLCISDGKAHKEEAIAQRGQNAFINDIRKLEKSIHKGSIKKQDTIKTRLSAKLKRHKVQAADYTVELISDESGKITGIKIDEKENPEDHLYGCYVIETTHTEKDAEEIWNMYMTLTQVEAAFKMMKSSLGVRPVYHQKPERCKAHLFISVLAYHLLMIIRRKLLEGDDHRYWDTIRETLSSHTRNTVIAHSKNTTYHIRVSGRPEAQHKEIYRLFGISDFLPRVVTSFNKN